MSRFYPTPIIPICPSSPNGHLYSLMVMTIFRVGIRMSDWLPRMSLHFNDIIPLIFTYVYVLGSARGSILKSLLSQILWNSSNVTKNNLLLLKIISVMSKKTNYFMIYIILIFSKSFLCIAHFTELDSIHKPQRSETFHSKTIYYSFSRWWFFPDNCQIFGKDKCMDYKNGTYL